MRSGGDLRTPRRLRSGRRKVYAVAVAVVAVAVSVFLRAVNRPDVTDQERVTVQGQSWIQHILRGRPETTYKLQGDGSLSVQSTGENGERKQYRMEQTPAGVVILDEQSERK